MMGVITGGMILKIDDGELVFRMPIPEDWTAANAHEWDDKAISALKKMLHQAWDGYWTSYEDQGRD